jgi:NAD(P)H-hydrate epimerase
VNSPVVTSAQMRDAENAAFARGISAEVLMNQAGAGIAQAVQQFFPRPGYCVVFSGKGNNGGDALVAAARLKRAGWHTDVHLSFPESQCSDLLRRKITEFRDTPPVAAGVLAVNASGIPNRTIILDGLLGLGSKPPLRDPILAACREINRLRQERGAYVFAVDQPTGLDGDSGETDRDCVVADFTVTVAAAKRGLIADNATNFVGRLEVLALSDLPLEAADESVACTASLRGLLPRRQFNAHKNQFGRVGIVAGSRGFAGASTMSTWGALRAGAGLVEVFVPENIYEVTAAAAPFESMVKPLKSYRDLIEETINVWGIGPGLGRDNASEIIELIQRAENPMVVDADALNIVSTNVGILKNCRGPRLLTPHPGEMKRLAGNLKISRTELTKKFTSEFPITLLLKGSRTIVAEEGKFISYNTTGNPGMATGGMGDVLTGMVAGFLGQGLKPFEAAAAAVYVHGLAGDLAARSDRGLLATELAQAIPSALRKIGVR